MEYTLSVSLDKNFVRLLAPRLKQVFDYRMNYLGEWLHTLRLPIAKKVVGCRGPDFGYFRYRGTK